MLQQQLTVVDDVGDVKDSYTRIDGDNDKDITERNI